MKRIAARLMYPLEDMIKRNPSFAPNYLLHSDLSKLTENRHSLLDLFSSMTPLPGEGLLVNSLRTTELLNSEAIKREDWDFVILYSTASWDTYTEKMRLEYYGLSEIQKNYLWKILESLIEALLAKNDVAEADRVFTDFMEKIPSPDLQSQLVQIANKREKPELARKWGVMNPIRSN